MTQEQFNQDYGRIAMPKPFAHDGLITPIVDIGDSTHPVNFADGFPSEYSAPHSQGGKYVTRGEFNAIGNLATRNDFYRACGGLNTFNTALASKIGGYPKGAVLQLLDNNVLKYVISLVDNNTVNFNTAGVDGVNWMFCYESKHEEEEEKKEVIISEKDVQLPYTSGTSSVLIKYIMLEIGYDCTAQYSARLKHTGSFATKPPAFLELTFDFKEPGEEKYKLISLINYEVSPTPTYVEQYSFPKGTKMAVVANYLANAYNSSLTDSAFIFDVEVIATKVT